MNKKIKKLKKKITEERYYCSRQQNFPGWQSRAFFAICTVFVPESDSPTVEEQNINT